ncbi:acyltransferase family protein [Leclercia pneumoniae]|uniref:acyltransferase n=1 Tax=Leclercia pneumoniae TaxID=2815358 RepID=UPI002DBF1B54|nr:acyltransferase family protein [Leclercia pneumoniae]MEB7499001.1 acyltransferase family protein [Leclercia pneumoniae]
MKERIIWLDNIRASACILVVILHTVSMYVIKFDKNGIEWHTANIIDSISRICVPLFFMISGFIFMRKKEVKIKNITKLLSNLALYTFIAAIYLVLFKEKTIGYVFSPIIFFNSIEKPVFYHLWFFYDLLICYFIFSILSIKDTNPKSLMAASFILFILFNPTTSNLTSNLFGFSYEGILSINDQILFYVLYGALGASIGSLDIKHKYAYYFLFIFILTSLMTAYLTYQVSLERGKFSSVFYNYTSLLVMVSSLSLFSFIKAKGNSFNIFGNATKFIAAASLPIYGIHAFILEWLLDAHIDKYITPLGIPLTFIIVFIPSMMFGMLLMKIDKKKIFS